MADNNTPRTFTDADFADDPSTLKPVKASAARKLGDLALGFGQGAVGATKALSDAFGANNAVSQGLEGANQFLDAGISRETKDRRFEADRIQQEAKGKGIAAEVAGFGRAFATDPIQQTVQGLGSVVPFVAAQFVPGVGQSATAARVAQIGMGLGMGAGTAKGAIHEEVQKRELAAGKTAEQAKDAADVAQAYFGVNTDQIALGAGLGLADAVTGATPAAVRLLRQKLGKEVAKDALGNPVESGILKSGVKGALGEMPVEFAQGGQEQLAANVAAQRAGYEADTWEGVVGKGGMEALASAGPGAAFGIAGRNRGIGSQPQPQPQPQPDPNAQGGMTFDSNVPPTLDARALDAAGVSMPPPAAVLDSGRIDRMADLGAAQPSDAELLQQQEGGDLISRTFDPRAGVAPPLSLAPNTPASDSIPYQQPEQKPFGQNFTMPDGGPPRQAFDEAQPLSKRMGLDASTGPLSAAAVTAVDSGASPAAAALASGVGGGFGLGRTARGEPVDVTPINQAAGRIGATKRLGETPIIDVEARWVDDTPRQGDLMAPNNAPFQSQALALQASQQTPQGGEVVAVPNGFVVRPQLLGIEQPAQAPRLGYDAERKGAATRLVERQTPAQAPQQQPAQQKYQPNTARAPESRQNTAQPSAEPPSLGMTPMQQRTPRQQPPVRDGGTPIAMGMEGGGNMGGAGQKTNIDLVSSSQQEAPTRPANWRKNMISAAKVAKGMGIVAKGKKLVDLVADIDSADAAKAQPEKPAVLQNRNRATAASIQQMQDIAARPDYGRLGFSRDFANGAPVVAGVRQGAVPEKRMGRKDTTVASNGKRITVQYAVMEASDILTSNTADGFTNADYGDTNKQAIRAIAGNGRVAGLQAAYDRKTAESYKTEMMADAALHGIDAKAIKGMKRPVLVRVMPDGDVTADIGDISNTQSNLSLSPVEQAKNDMARLDFDALTFGEDGDVTAQSVRQFVQVMPKTEQGALLDTNGQPTRQAVDRLNAAIFARAYGNDQLVRLYAQAQDPEARLVMSALAQAAPKMARLEGLGALDVREIVAQAAEIAVNARREGKAIALAAQQLDMAADPAVAVVLDLFAASPRSNKPVIEALSNMAEFAYTEGTKPDEDMFGTVPRATREQVLQRLKPTQPQANQEPQDANERPSQSNLEQPTGGKPAQSNDVGSTQNARATANPSATQKGRPAQAPAAGQDPNTGRVEPSESIDGIVISLGKGLIKGKFRATVDGVELPGDAFSSEKEAVDAALQYREVLARRAQEAQKEQNQKNTIASKLRNGEPVTNAQIESVALKADFSDMRFFISNSAELFGLNARQIRPIVKGLIKIRRSDMGTEYEYVPTRKALEAIATALKKADNTGNTQSTQAPAVGQATSEVKAKPSVIDKMREAKAKKDEAARPDLALSAYTPKEIEAQQAAQEAAAKKERDRKAAEAERQRQDDERARIKKMSEAAADTFVLGGDAMDNLTGQQDVFGAMGQAAQPIPPKATELTPKKFHEAKLAFIAADTGANMADVRENYDTEAGRAENQREWAGQVERAAKAGEVLTRQTLDKLYELAPNVRLPETAIPQGYQRPEARKAEVETTAADVTRATADARAAITEAIDAMPAQHAQKIAAGFFTSMGLPRVLGKKAIKATITDKPLNLLAAASEFGVELSLETKAALQAEFEGRVVAGGVAAEPAPSFSDLEKELQAKSHAKELTGDVGIVAGGGAVQFVSMPDAIDAMQKAIASGVKPVPFQIHNATGIRLGDVDGVLSAMKASGEKSETKKEETKPASKTPTVDAHAALMDAVRDGKATPEQFKAGFEALVAGVDAIKSELGTHTKPDLLKMGGPYMRMRYASENKPEIIDALYREMLGEFLLGESLTYGMGKNSYRDGIAKRVETVDADKLAKYVAERKVAIEEAAAHRVAAAQAAADPKTLDDFRAAIRTAMMDGKTRKEAYLTLTPEQRIRFDELDAESTRDARETRKRAQKTQVQAAGQTTGGQIIATKHTRDGYDLFVVQLSDRLSKEDYATVLASAKRMGGWYSAFRGNGATSGFQFKEKVSAEAFLKLAGGDTTAAQDQAAQRRDAFEDDRSQTAAERLTEMADRLEAQADEEMGRDRKANTARRARFAASAEAAASNVKALAKTMRNIATALGEGKAKFLDAVRQKAQVEMLAGVVATAKYNELVARFPDYADREKRNGEPPTIGTADFAEFPTFTAFRSDLAGLARQMLEVDGTKKLGQQLMGVADDVTDAYLDFAKSNLLAVSQFGRGGAMANFSSKAEAEAAIRRSGLAGKAIVLPIKRGENRVILSPSEAMNRGVWKGDGDKRITLTKDAGMELVQAIGRKGNQTNGLKVPWQFETAADRLKALSRMGIETPAEFRSAVREFISLRVQAQEADRVKAMERAMVGRKADGLDFFPTPAEVADQMVEAAGIEPDMAVLEPSAGMGHLADRIRAAGAEPDVVELSGDRRELLEEKGFTVVGTDFMQMKPRSFFTYGDVFSAPDGKEGVMRGQGGMGSDRVRLVDDAGNILGYYNRDELTGVRHSGTESGYDRIIMNPPFGDRRDAEHVRHAYGLLKPGGRLVAIMGEGVFFGKDKKAEDFREWLDALGGTSEKLPSGSFLDPSLPVTTGVNARMVVVEKQDDILKMSRGGATLPPTITVDGVERPTTNSNGQQIAATDEGVRNFWRWFGDSKVVDSNGRPLVVYHGTQAQFTEFDPDTVGDSNYGSSGAGFWFTTDWGQARRYWDASGRNPEKPNVLEVYLKADNPLFANPAEEAEFLAVDIGIEDFDSTDWVQVSEILQYADWAQDKVNHALKRRNDSLQIKDSGDAPGGTGSGDHWVVFSPTQIKSATGNNWEFDPQNPSILKSRTENGNRLPDAVIRHRLGELNSHPDYDAAKSGDPVAAARIALDLVDDAMVDAVRAAAGNADLIVPVLSIEASGKNKIPQAVADELAHRLGSSANYDIVQVNSPKRTSMDGLSRLLNPPMFGGPVKRGAFYVLVDDTITQGGTFAALASHIIDNGGKIAGAVALTGKQYSAKLAPSSELLQKVRELYQSVEPAFKSVTGYGFDALTESEARYLAKHNDAQSVRDRIIEAGFQRIGGSDSGRVEEVERRKSQQSTQPVAPRTPKTAIKAALDKAYGRLFGRLEAKGLVTLTQTEQEAIEAAAQVRADKLGRDYKAELAVLMSAVSQSQAGGDIDVKYSANGAIQGFFDPATKQAFIVADALTEGVAGGVLMHEVGIHMAASGGKLTPLLNRAALMVKNGKGAFFDGVRAKMERAGETSPEEAAAYLVEAYENSRGSAPSAVQQWFKDFVAAVRAWVFKAGGGLILSANQLTAADIAAVARANARGFARGGRVGGAGAGLRRSFAGEMAATADKLSLAAAQERLSPKNALQRMKTKDTPEKVRQETGWHRGVDKKWRFEINDRDATLKDKALWHHKDAGPFARVQVGDVLQHPALFAAYPKLRDIPITLDPSMAAGEAYLSRSNFFGADTGFSVVMSGKSGNEALLSDLLHELQHAIQYVEGFGAGADAKQIGSERYRKSAGEVEARNVQTRHLMTDQQRKATSPKTTQDVNDIDVVVSFNGQVAWTAPRPANAEVPIQSTDEDGMPVINGDGVTLQFGEPTERIEFIPVDESQKMIRFQIGSESNPFAGQVDVLFENGKPTALYDIEVSPSERGKSLATKTVKALLDASPNGKLDISNIVTEAQDFWATLGVPTQPNLPKGYAYDGTITRESYEASPAGKNARAAGRVAQSWTGGREKETGSTTGQTTTGIEVQELSWEDAQKMGIRFSRAGGNGQPHTGAVPSYFDVKGGTNRAKEGMADRLADWRGLSMQALGRRQIVDLWGKLLPQLGSYDDLVQKMDAEKNATAAGADELAHAWAKLDGKGFFGLGKAENAGMETKLAELMHDATLGGVDADPSVALPSNATVPQKMAKSALTRRFEGLTPDAQAVYRKVRNIYADQNKAIRKALKERIERAAELSPDSKRTMIARMDAELMWEKQGVYFPLARFGKYLVVVKDASGKTMSVSRAETLPESKKLRAELQSRYPSDQGFRVSKVYLDHEFNAARDAVGKGFMGDLVQALRNQGMDEGVIDSVGQLYLKSLPDLSWAKHGIHRKGTPGFSQDARRAFAQNMIHGASHLAKLRHADKLQMELADMQAHIKANQDDDGFDNVKAVQVYDEMVKRHELLMSPKTHPFSNTLTSVGFFFYLGLSPASAVVNLSQTALLAYPIMGAKWGYDKAGAALLKASAEVTKAKNDYRSALQGDELKALNQAIDDGTIDVTMAHDLAGIASGNDGPGWAAGRKLMWAASFMFHHAEKFNRQATFIAAYRLARENPKTTHEQAFAEARKATYDGHFDYASSNRSRIMQGNWAKVLLLFKQYGQNMVYTLARQTYLSIRGETPEQKREARKAIAGILALHASAAGVLGLPVVGTLLALASAMGGDDDEPWDAKVAIQNILAESLGQKPAEVLAHGLSRLTPWDMSGRVALNSLMLPDVQEGLEGQRLAESSMTAALGPVAGIFVGLAKGAQKMSQGDYQRGFEDMLPVSLRNPLKALRYYNEGNVDKTGLVINDEVSLAGVTGQALGFSPSETRLAAEGKQAIYQADKRLGERRAQLMRLYSMAKMADDDEGVTEARESIARFNTKNPDRKITVMQLAQSVKDKRKRIAEAQQGVYLPEKRRGALEAGRFADVSEGAEDR